MSREALRRLTSAEARLAAARSHAYRLFLDAFDYPDEGVRRTIRSGAPARALRTVLAAINPGLVEDTEWDALADPGQGDELAVEHTRLFDVGVSGPPCPLYGGLYCGPRMKTMEEAVRFYNHFGLTLSEAPRELPDHLTTELEFLHYLTYREAEILERRGDAGAFRRAERDFLARHPGRWLPRMRQRLLEQKPVRFFRELVLQLERFLEDERERLRALAGPSPS